MKRKRWMALLIWLIMTCYLCIQAGEKSKMLSGFLAQGLYPIILSLSSIISYESAHYFIRKIAHFVMHFVLGTLIYRALETVDRDKTIILVKSLTTAILIAVSNELIQNVAISRGPMPSDAFINIAGVIFGTHICYILHALKE
ncbi:VanZ family protein [Candidatus Saccharibacteria bacterium]|nr:VanZ family protein [Candidatus Saccharibacteria bacterium]